MKFHVEGVLCPGCSIRMVPLNYKGSEYSDREGLNLGKYPVCNWSSDLYTNWVTQNGVNVATSIGTAVGSTVMGAVTGGLYGGVGGAIVGGVGAGIGGVSQIANALNEVHKAEMIPPQSSGNINCGDVVTSMKENTFHIYRMSIKQEFAERIDQYFTRLGYRVNKVKVPNMGNRANYNYVQVAQEENVAYPNNYNNICLPATALDTINSLFRNGVTIWNNHANFGDYSVSNANTYVPPTP